MISLLFLITIVVAPQLISADIRHELTPLQWPTLWKLDNPDLYYPDDLLVSSIAAIRVESLLDVIPVLTNQTSACAHDLKILIDGASRRDLWAVKVFDAWGKPLPSGVLTGNIFWLGNYDECINELYQENNRSFVRQPINTQYCALHSTPTQPVDVRTSPILGLCLPASCNRQSILVLLSAIFNITDLTKNNLHCSNDRINEPNIYWKGTVAFIVIVSILFLVVFIGTLIDFASYVKLKKEIKVKTADSEFLELSNGTTNRNNMLDLAAKSFNLFWTNHPWLAFLSEFSAIRTLRYIFDINKSDGESSFPCLNGIRVLSLFWVILGHSFSSGIYYAANMVHMQAARRNLFVHLLISGGFAVDTFFILSGFLTTVLFIRQVNKEKRLSSRLMILYYIHRYFRLTPSFIFVMFVSIYLTPYFGHGPLYPIQQGFEPEKCRNGNWWSAFLYIGNFFRSDDICLGITWYLYNDMQFHWIAPLALIPFIIRRKKIAYIMTLIFILISVGSTLGLLLYYPSFVQQGPGLNNNETQPVFFDKVYMAPWCRIAPYAIGILLGFIITETGRRYNLKLSARILGNFLAIILGLGSIFWNYLDDLHSSGRNRNSVIAYNILSRITWSIATAWLIFLCSINHGGIIRRFLSSSLWLPLVRLNYAAYLVHIIVIFIALFNQSNPLYYQLMSCIHSFVSQLIFSYMAATVVVILFERPFLILERRYLKK